MKQLTSSIAAMAVIIGLAGTFAVASAEPQSSGKKQNEYVPTSKTTPLLQDELQAFPGKEVQVIKYELAPGWVGGRHYHTGDVFVYVLEGQFVLDLDGKGRKTFGAGEVFHETVNVKMTARNGVAGGVTKILLFQVGNKSEPLMIKAD